MTKFLSTAKLRVFRMLCAHDVDVRTVGFAVSFRSCRAIQGGFLLLAMLCSYLVSDTWSLPSLSRSTRRALASLCSPANYRRGRVLLGHLINKEGLASIEVLPFKCTCKYLEKYRRTSLSAVRRGKTAVGNAYDELCEETETLNLKSKS